MSDSVGKAYKPWIFVSLAILLASLTMLGVAMTVAFLSLGPTTPLWVVVLAVLSGIGVMLGFGGFFLLMTVAAWNAWRESRRATG